MTKQRKNIDRLFQEKFKDFEVIPDEAVWDRIKAHQEQKKKRRGLLIPLWFRVAGVAAVALLLFTLGSVWRSEESATHKITNTETKLKNPAAKEHKDAQTNEERFVTAEKDLPENHMEDFRKESVSSRKNMPANDDTVKTNLKDTRGIDKTSERYATTEQTVPEDKSTNGELPQIGREENKMAGVHKPFSAIGDEKIEEDQQTKLPASGITTKTEDTVQYHTGQIAGMIKKNENNNDLDIPKKSIFEVAEEASEKEEIEIVEKDGKRWKIAPIVAPVYYNSFGRGSSIDPEFADNITNGQLNMSYGVQIAYSVSKKLSVRSGINTVSLGYGTQDVGFSPSIQAQRLKNISYSPNAKAIELSDYTQDGLSRSLLVSETSSLQKSSVQNKGVLSLTINYIEIPMEMKYAITDKKLGIHVIGGFSTLVLRDNELFINAGNFTSTIGETNNVKDVSFTSNLGIGMDYQLSDKFKMQVEPILKYQLSAYENTSGNFNPYYFGIYTGISYQF